MNVFPRGKFRATGPHPSKHPSALTRTLKFCVVTAMLFVPVAQAQTPVSAEKSTEKLSDRWQEQPGVQAFIAEMTSKHGFESQEISKLFDQIKINNDVLRYISPAPSGSKRNWSVYRARFLDALRIREGVKFWRQYEQEVARASNTYGVPQEVIVSIIGVETIYGRNTGSFKVLEALSTLAFSYPRRADYFRSELEAFLLMTREHKLEPLSVLGSFAGAIGLPQFMPSNIGRYGVDFDNSGGIDLRTSPIDAIGSVARFLAEHGWAPGRTARYALQFKPDAKTAELIAAGILPQFTSQQLDEMGVSAAASTPPDELLALIDLPNGDGATDFVLGAKNFYVVTRYNRSSFYAMAVLDLADVLRRQMMEPVVAKAAADTTATRAHASKPRNAQRSAVRARQRQGVR